jgi:uncharacterized iron-regulated membrane protein
VVFLIVSFSGVDLAFPDSVAAAMRLVSPVRELRGAPALPPGEGGKRQRLELDAAIATAEAGVGQVGAEGGEAVVRSVFLPARPDQPFRVTLERPGEATPVTVFVDPFAPRILEVRDPRGFTLAERVLAWQRALHTGAGTGWGWRSAEVLVGFLPTLFVVTGLSMWTLRRRARRAAAVRR